MPYILHSQSHAQVARYQGIHRKTARIACVVEREEPRLYPMGNYSRLGQGGDVGVNGLLIKASWQIDVSPRMRTRYLISPQHSRRIIVHATSSAAQ